MGSTTANIATATLVASTTSTASATAKIPEVSPWVSYGVDIVIALAFLYVLFFTKAETNTNNNEELSAEEMPNELEQVIRTDPEEEKSAEAEEEKKE